MARPSDGPTSRSILIAFRVTPEEDRMIDEQRGSTSRSAYLRNLIRRDAQNGKQK